MLSGACALLPVLLCFLCCCAAVLLCCCAAVLLCCCAAVLLATCGRVLLSSPTLHPALEACFRRCGRGQFPYRHSGALLWGGRPAFRCRSHSARGPMCPPSPRLFSFLGRVADRSLRGHLPSAMGVRCVSRIAVLSSLSGGPPSRCAVLRRSIGGHLTLVVGVLRGLSSCRPHYPKRPSCLAATPPPSPVLVVAVSPAGVLQWSPSPAVVGSRVVVVSTCIIWRLGLPSTPTSCGYSAVVCPQVGLHLSTACPHVDHQKG